MAYIGREPLGGEVILLNSIESQFNGVLTTFNLTRTVSGVTSAFYPVGSQQLLVSLGGVIQRPDPTGDTGFRISFNTIIFAIAPAAGTSCFIISYGNLIDIGAPANNTVTTDKLVDGSVTPVKLSTGGPWWLTSGNVGIGTTNPTQKLQVHSGGILVKGAVTPNINFEPAGTLGNADISFDGNIFNLVSNSSSAKLILGTSSTPRLSILSAGNVGIGTTNPTEKVHLYDNYAITENSFTRRIGLYNVVERQTASDSYAASSIFGTYNSYIQVPPLNTSASVFSVTGTRNDVGIYVGSVTGTVYGNYNYTTLGPFSGTTPVSVGDVVSTYNELNILNQANTVTNAYGVRNILTVNPNATITNHYGVHLSRIGAGTITNNWSIYSSDTSSKMYHAGNVSIGTTNSTAKLHVKSNDASEAGVNNGFVTDALVGFYGGLRTTISAGNIIDTGIVHIKGQITDANAGSTGTHETGKLIFSGRRATGAQSIVSNETVWDYNNQTAGSKLSFWTAGVSNNGGTAPTRALTIDQGQNIGIGTTAPDVKFHVWAGQGKIGARTKANTGTTLALSTTDASSRMELLFEHTASSYWRIQAVEQDVAYRPLVLQNDGGNVGIGITNPGFKLEVNGSFAATTKSFLIEHPTKEKYKLRHGSLEGPENGVYVRGRTSTNIIELPDYWTGLVDEDSITVNLTSIGNRHIWVEEINNNKVYINSEDTIDCFYTVFAERKDVEKLIVEIEEN